ADARRIDAAKRQIVLSKLLQAQIHAQAAGARVRLESLDGALALAPHVERQRLGRRIDFRDDRVEGVECQDRQYRAEDFLTANPCTGRHVRQERWRGVTRIGVGCAAERNLAAGLDRLIDKPSDALSMPTVDHAWKI